MSDNLDLRQPTHLKSVESTADDKTTQMAAWQNMDDAPRDGTVIEAMTNGEPDLVSYEEHRY